MQHKAFMSIDQRPECLHIPAKNLRHQCFIIYHALYLTRTSFAMLQLFDKKFLLKKSFQKICKGFWELLQHPV